MQSILLRICFLLNLTCETNTCFNQEIVKAVPINGTTYYVYPQQIIYDENVNEYNFARQVNTPCAAKKDSTITTNLQIVNSQSYIPENISLFNPTEVVYCHDETVHECKGKNIISFPLVYLCPLIEIQPHFPLYLNYCYECGKYFALLNNSTQNSSGDVFLEQNIKTESNPSVSSSNNLPDENINLLPGTSNQKVEDLNSAESNNVENKILSFSEVLKKAIARNDSQSKVENSIPPKKSHEPNNFENDRNRSTLNPIRSKQTENKKLSRKNLLKEKRENRQKVASKSLKAIPEGSSHIITSNRYEALFKDCNNEETTGLSPEDGLGCNDSKLVEQVLIKEEKSFEGSSNLFDHSINSQSTANNQDIPSIQNHEISEEVYCEESKSVLYQMSSTKIFYSIKDIEYFRKMICAKFKDELLIYISDIIQTKNGKRRIRNKEMVDYKNFLTSEAEKHSSMLPMDSNKHYLLHLDDNLDYKTIYEAVQAEENMEEPQKISKNYHKDKKYEIALNKVVIFIMYYIINVELNYLDISFIKIMFDCYFKIKNSKADFNIFKRIVLVFLLNILPSEFRGNLNCKNREEAKDIQVCNEKFTKLAISLKEFIDFIINYENLCKSENDFIKVLKKSRLYAKENYEIVQIYLQFLKIVEVNLVIEGEVK
ncbi:hypothetical protein H312_01989 [Anncaliia algerae PRA339]|uniref:Rho-GAP domain-containing protein n=1 Tax=Anncaliia algerae PRA339 TaxID=1288291 RepID=A0A059F0V6_9MICR|nr:hypothetical protein H312_01989 [Anncaliia algerae PRA339]